jgi:hypothetical protein
MTEPTKERITKLMEKLDDMNTSLTEIYRIAQETQKNFLLSGSSLSKRVVELGEHPTDADILRMDSNSRQAYSLASYVLTVVGLANANLWALTKIVGDVADVRIRVPKSIQKALRAWLRQQEQARKAQEQYIR